MSKIYKEKNKGENYFILRIKSMIGTIIVLLTIITVLILLVFGNRINSIIEYYFPNLSNIANYILNIRNIITMISLFIIFVMIYSFIPGKGKSMVKKQIPGAIFASIRMDFSVIFFFNLYKYLYKFFSDLW